MIRTPRIKVERTLEHFSPAPARPYCLGLWDAQPFELLITPDRSSKLGDFKVHHHVGKGVITLNAGLNPYLFLMTYVHEVSHWYAYIKYGPKIAPHGAHWKHTFRELMIPILNREVWPDPIFIPLVRHMHNPKAAAGVDPKLTLAFKAFDTRPRGLHLYDIAPGELFLLKGRLFRKETLRRSRSLCVEVKTGKRYLVPELAEVMRPTEG
jgi:SprT protein